MILLLALVWTMSPVVSGCEHILFPLALIMNWPKVSL